MDRKVSTLAGNVFAHPAVDRLRSRRYARELERHQHTRRPLAELSAKIVENLETNGIVQMPLVDLGIEDSSELVAISQQLVAKELADFRSQADAGHTFLMMRAAPLVARPEIYLFGLSATFLDIAEAYLGLPVGYDGVSIQYTLANGDEEATRLWHRDREDRKMLKIAVYLNDVAGDGGPFELLSRRFDFRSRSQRYLFSAEERVALDAGQLGTPVSCEGPSGTTIFADTATYFHRGRPAVGRDRSAIFYSYFAQRPEYPFFCERSGLRRADIRRIVRSLTPRQRRAALWRDRIAFPLRLIPSYPIL